MVYIHNVIFFLMCQETQKNNIICSKLTSQQYSTARASEMFIRIKSIVKKTKTTVLKVEKLGPFIIQHLFN